MKQELTALTKRWLLLLNSIAKASDEIKRIDNRLTSLLGGQKPGSGALA
jgi:hypothetical protein